MPEINFAGVPESKEFSAAPAGDYILELVDAVDGTTRTGKNKGNPNTALQFEITDCEGDLEEFNGRRVYYYATYGEAGLPQLKAMLKAFGAEVDDSEGAEELKWDWDDLLGKKLMANLRVRPATKNPETGQEYSAKNEIKRFLVPGSEE